MDNYYTSITLLIFLRVQGIHSIGTINRNRIKNCKLPDPKAMMKMNRDVSAEFTSNIQVVELTSISWKDNKVVNLVFTFVGVKPLLAEHGVAVDVPTIERWDKKNHKITTIPCSQIIKEYNLHRCRPNGFAFGSSQNCIEKQKMVYSNILPFTGHMHGKCMATF